MSLKKKLIFLLFFVILLFCIVYIFNLIKNPIYTLDKKEGVNLPAQEIKSLVNPRKFTMPGGYPIDYQYTDTSALNIIQVSEEKIVYISSDGQFKLYNVKNGSVVNLGQSVFDITDGKSFFLATPISNETICIASTTVDSFYIDCAKIDANYKLNKIGHWKVENISNFYIIYLKISSVSNNSITISLPNITLYFDGSVEINKSSSSNELAFGLYDNQQINLIYHEDNFDVCIQENQCFNFQKNHNQNEGILPGSFRYIDGNVFFLNDENQLNWFTFNKSYFNWKYFIPRF